MWYYMLNPNCITECRGKVTDAQVMWELGININQFNNLVRCQYPYYKNSILVEVAQDADRSIFSNFNEVLLLEKNGQKWYACRNCTIKKIHKNGKVRIMKPWWHFNRYEIKVNNVIHNANRLFAKTFLKEDLSSSDIVILNGELKLENMTIMSRSECSAFFGSNANKIGKKIGYFENGELVKTYQSASEASKELYISSKAILSACRGEVKKPRVDVRYI